MTGFLGASAPIFEIRDCGGAKTDMLIRTRELGAALARSVGPASFALMRGHGSVAVGSSVKQVVYRAIYAEVNARLQADAMRLGKVTFLNDDEATNAATASDAQLDRPWELWKKKGTYHSKSNLVSVPKFKSLLMPALLAAPAAARAAPCWLGPFFARALGLFRRLLRGLPQLSERLLGAPAHLLNALAHLLGYLSRLLLHQLPDQLPARAAAVFSPISEERS
jgi:hypothetical protein